MGPKPFTDAEKGCARTLREEEVSIIEICSQLVRGKTTVKRLLSASRHLLPNEVPTHKTRPGAKKKTSKSTDRHIVIALKKVPHLTAQQLKEIYNEELKNVSERTVQQGLLKDLKIPSHTAALKVLLMDKMKKKRLKFAMEHMDWAVDKWMEVM